VDRRQKEVVVGGGIAAAGDSGKAAQDGA